MKYPTIIIDDSSIQRLATTFLVKNHPKLDLIGAFDNPFEGVKAIYDHKAEIVFLDVLMDKVDAFEILDSIEVNAAIIMNSTWSKFAMPAYDYGINDFLTKPISKKRFEQSVAKIIERLELKKNAERPIKTFPFSEALSEFP
ncbi:LytR/AlgR family response regulator transcription factor [Croceitalea sp. MTPC5]|uniref:LytR/AlgR family response regulator transcription factor n=1 Tax=Croceitalea sp. MTPC5 TaxID=3056565 RepID=UPI0030CCF0C6